MSNNVTDNKNTKQSFCEDVFLIGIKDGLKASYSIVKIMVPISFIITIFKFLGIINAFSALVTPFFKFLGLQGHAVLAILSGYFINCYSAIAVMESLPLTMKEISIISCMLLLCHTLPVELSVQKKAGGSLLLILFVRLSASILMGAILNLIIPGSTGQVELDVKVHTAVNMNSFMNSMVSWLTETVLVIKIVIINILIIIFYRLLNRYMIIAKVSGFFKQIMLVFGLAKESAFMWLIINIVGLIYGASMLIEAKDKRHISEIEQKKLNLSICTCHSMIQETANFMTLGCNPAYLIIPRIVISIITVWIYNLYSALVKNRESKRMLGT